MMQEYKSARGEIKKSKNRKCTVIRNLHRRKRRNLEMFRIGNIIFDSIPKKYSNLNLNNIFIILLFNHLNK